MKTSGETNETFLRKTVHRQMDRQADKQMERADQKILYKLSKSHAYQFPDYNTIILTLITVKCSTNVSNLMHPLAKKLDIHMSTENVYISYLP